MEKCVYASAPAESDLQQINARAFSWFNHFLPRVDAIDDDNAHTHFECGGGAQVIYNMEAPTTDHCFEHLHAPGGRSGGAVHDKARRGRA
jgi:hypothetical protein